MGNVASEDHSLMREHTLTTITTGIGTMTDREMMNTYTEDGAVTQTETGDMHMLVNASSTMATIPQHFHTHSILSGSGHPTDLEPSSVNGVVSPQQAAEMSERPQLFSGSHENNMIDNTTTITTTEFGAEAIMDESSYAAALPTPTPKAGNPHLSTNLGRLVRPEDGHDPDQDQNRTQQSSGTSADSVSSYQMNPTGLSFAHVRSEETGFQSIDAVTSGPAILYDDDDLTAMTDMAHAGSNDPLSMYKSSRGSGMPRSPVAPSSAAVASLTSSQQNNYPTDKYDPRFYADSMLVTKHHPRRLIDHDDDDDDDDDKILLRQMQVPIDKEEEVEVEYDDEAGDNEDDDDEDYLPDDDEEDEEEDEDYYDGDQEEADIGDEDDADHDADVHADPDGEAELDEEEDAIIEVLDAEDEEIVHCDGPNAAIADQNELPRGEARSVSSKKSTDHSRRSRKPVDRAAETKEDAEDIAVTSVIIDAEEEYSRVVSLHSHSDHIEIVPENAEVELPVFIDDNVRVDGHCELSGNNVGDAPEHVGTEPVGVEVPADDDVFGPSVQVTEPVTLDSKVDAKKSWAETSAAGGGESIADNNTMATGTKRTESIADTELAVFNQVHGDGFAVERMAFGKRNEKNREKPEAILEDEVDDEIMDPPSQAPAIHDDDDLNAHAAIDDSLANKEVQDDKKDNEVGGEAIEASPEPGFHDSAGDIFIEETAPSVSERLVENVANQERDANIEEREPESTPSSLELPDSKADSHADIRDGRIEKEDGSERSSRRVIFEQPVRSFPINAYHIDEDEKSSRTSVRSEPFGYKSKANLPVEENKYRRVVKEDIDAPEARFRLAAGSLPTVTSAEFDDIDLAFVEQYERLFDAFLASHPHFMVQNSEMVNTLRVAKLQKILEMELQVESELDAKVSEIPRLKQEMAVIYQTKLLDSAKRKAAREIHLQQELSTLQQATRVMLGRFTWQLITKCDTRAKRRVEMLAGLNNQKMQADNPMALLPDDLAVQPIREAVMSSKDVTRAEGKEMDIRQLQVESAALNAQVEALEEEVSQEQASARAFNWVDSVFLSMDPKSLKRLRNRYQKKLGVNF